MTNQAELPESIKRQVAEAEALEQQLYGQPAPEEGNTEVAEEVPTEQPTEAPVEEAVKQPEPAVNTEEETFRRRYEVLNGKYAAEVPRLHAQVRETSEQLQRAFAEIERMKAEQTQKVEQRVQDNDAETFGEDLVEMADRRAEMKARELVAKETSQLRDYVKQLEAKLGVVNEQVNVSKEAMFMEQLGKMVPNYQSVNTDQGFLNWLGEIDPVYGLPRQAALDNAANSLDVQRVANIFLAYEQLTGKQVQAQKTQQVRKELERQVAPNTSAAQAAPSPAGKIWSWAEYEAALDPRNISKMGRSSADDLYAEAEQALAEGRVR